MSELQHDKQQGNHDDCQDCRRQKKQNQAWIKVYMKMQDIEKKSIIVQQAVKQHQINSQNNRSFYNSYQQKVYSLPKMKERTHSHVIEQLGFEVAAAVIETQAKNKVLQQNKKLKQILNNMQRQKLSQSLEIEENKKQQKICQQSNFQEQKSINFKYDRLNTLTISSNMNYDDIKAKTSAQVQNLQKSMLTQSYRQSYNDNNSTQSSSFKTTNGRKRTTLSKYNDLNLWLYENDRNIHLEKDLFLAKQQKTRHSLTNRLAQMLPSIKVKK